MFPQVVNLVKKGLTTTCIDEEGFEYKKHPTNLGATLYKPRSESPRVKMVTIELSDGETKMDPRILDNCFGESRLTTFFTKKEFDVFERIFYSSTLLSIRADDVIIYLRVCSSMDAKKELFDITRLVNFSFDDDDDEGPDPIPFQEELLRKIHNLYHSLELFPDQKVVKILLDSLPLFPGHHKVYQEKMVKDAYRKRGKDFYSLKKKFSCCTEEIFKAHLESYLS